MCASEEKSGRKPRADSLRNRERLLKAAKSVFSAGGAGASLEAVAREAGVGIGTLYRHFPTREALFAAVYRHETEQLVELAAEIGETEPPVEAMRHWLAATLDVIATKKGMLSALAPAPDGQAELYAYTGAAMRGALGGLMDRAVAAGEIRADITADDMMRALYGMVSGYYLRDQPGWKDDVLRLANIFIDGLRRLSA